MSEIIDNSRQKKEQLKSLIMKIQDPATAVNVRQEITELLKAVPYSDVVAVEQELFEQGVGRDNMLELCDLHSAALSGLITNPFAKKAPAGHPVHTMKRENQALKREISFLKNIFSELDKLADEEPAGEIMIGVHSHFNALMDVEKHYTRKEQLVFPYLEKYNITGPSMVMWGKDDEARQLLKNALAVVSVSHTIQAGEARAARDLALLPAIEAVSEMIIKEEEILLPMALDTLTDKDWYEIHRQSGEIGYCLYDPQDKWLPEGIEEEAAGFSDSSKIYLPTGAFRLEELVNTLNTMPFDFTFVDKDDHVRYFSQGKDRVFLRGKAILGRKVQFCHPPSSVSTVEKILDDFRSGRQDKAAFWINMRGKFIYISYYAVRNETGEYLGTLEVTQDLTELRQLDGERRILSYEN